MDDFEDSGTLCLGVKIDFHDIKAGRKSLRCRMQVAFCRRAEMAPLAFVYRFRRSAVDALVIFGQRAGLDFTEHKAVAFLRHDVHLVTAEPGIPVQNKIAVLYQAGGGAGRADAGRCA